MAKETRKPIRKTLYIDSVTGEALDYLKALPSRSGMSFSIAALFREFLEFLEKSPGVMLAESGWSRRGQSKGRFISVPLTDAEQAALDRLVVYYVEHASEDQRIRDGSPKIKRLPVSQLFADFIRSQAMNLGWQQADKSFNIM